jgi:hypothetical protein
MLSNFHNEKHYPFSLVRTPAAVLMTAHAVLTATFKENPFVPSAIWFTVRAF